MGGCCDARNVGFFWNKGNQALVILLVRHQHWRLAMDENRVEGSVRDFSGKAKSAVGDLTGDSKTQAEGTVDQVVGTAQRAYGKVRDTVSSGNLADQLDDASAYVGDVVADRPLTALLVAGAVGYALAMLTRR
jgi:uncharacterized protein YjbJ (UPF0337 family)